MSNELGPDRGFPYLIEYHLAGRAEQHYRRHPKEWNTEPDRFPGYLSKLANSSKNLLNAQPWQVTAAHISAYLRTGDQKISFILRNQSSLFENADPSKMDMKDVFDPKLNPQIGKITDTNGEIFSYAYIDGIELPPYYGHNTPLEEMDHPFFINKVRAFPYIVEHVIDYLDESSTNAYVEPTGLVLSVSIKDIRKQPAMADLYIFHRQIHHQLTRRLRRSK